MKTIKLLLLVTVSIFLITYVASAEEPWFTMTGKEIAPNLWDFTLTNNMPNTPENVGIISGIDLYWTGGPLVYTVQNTPADWVNANYIPGVVSFDSLETSPLPGSSLSGFIIEFGNGTGPADGFTVYDSSN
ncbi:MAG: hypothetical protein SNJ70_02275 [Armatimonadota bacterium]